MEARQQEEGRDRTKSMAAAGSSPPSPASTSPSLGTHRTSIKFFNSYFSTLMRFILF
jgi:hypothetical protein